MKKKKLALATAIATLTAGFSMFASVPASADRLSDEMIVIEVGDRFALVAVPELTDSIPTYRSMLCSFYFLSTESPEFAPIAGQVKYGDVICCSGYDSRCTTEIVGINSMYFDEDEDESNCKMEIVGSVLDTSFENCSPITVDGQTFIQITGSDGTRYVIENEANYSAVDDFLSWENDGGYNGVFYSDLVPTPEVPVEYSEELANKYNRESGHPIWIRPNEDGDVNSDDKVDSADASVILEEIALYGVGDTGKMNTSESKAADVNGDGVINAKDAAVILSYSAQVGSGMLEGVSLRAYTGQS